MIDSPAKRNDIATRLQVLELLAEVMIVFNRTKEQEYLGIAKKLGEESQKLKQRIDTHNYAEDDAREARLREMDRRWDGLK